MAFKMYAQAITGSYCLQLVELLKNVSYLFHVSIHVHKQHSDQYLYYNLFVYKPLHDFRDYAEKFKIFTVPTS